MTKSKMSTTITKHQLTSLLFATASPGHAVGHVVTINGVRGVFSGIEREDGSGMAFNVTLNTPSGKATVFVRTVD